MAIDYVYQSSASVTPDLGEYNKLQAKADVKAGEASNIGTAGKAAGTAATAAIGEYNKAQAAKETTELIQDSVTKVKKGSEIATDTEQFLKNIVESSSKVTDLVIEISDASNDPDHGISQIVTALSLIDQVTQKTTANANIAAAVSDLRTKISSLVSKRNSMNVLSR